MKARVLALLASIPLLGLGLAAAEAPGNPWGKVVTPASGSMRAVGDYSGGCVQGARALPLDGPGYQVMHPSRRRNYGHAALVDFVQTLGKAVKQHELGAMLVGDLSQARGGRASGGHASHQSGLDVDVWFWHPKRAERGPLSSAERESLSARSILDGKTEAVQAAWKTKVRRVLELAAADARVERIFVHPWIKRELCALPAEQRGFLRKVRPWYGHDDHFHARLACPKDSPSCVPQAPVAAGDGCDELDYWLGDEARAEREKGRKQYQAKVIGERKWPEECDAVLAAEEAKAETPADAAR